ncbi:DUF418 domain-containing protein [Sphingomonas sp. PB2P19]|uniref:DUF418 domain-containing protein n=1 Tax=Sphingomonas rhamnosi TaxID=3096156 RepID=UPI002FC8D4D2
MTAPPTIASATEPDGASRLTSLDILRGVAILGILFMNINDMGRSFSNPDIRTLGWTAADQIAWWLRAILADGTARAMLEMLFGAGMVILTDRLSHAAEDDEGLVLQRYYWRNAVLWVFGIIHMVVLLWPGDILHTYAIAAMLAFWFRRLPPRWLLTLGLAGAVLQLGGAGYWGVYAPLQARAEVTALTARRDAGIPLDATQRATLARAAERAATRARAVADHAAIVAAEDAARSGTTADWIGAQTAKSIERLGFGEIFSILEAATTMLIGAALFRLGILQGNRSRRFYARLTLAAYGVGLSLRAWGAYEVTRFTDAPQWNWATSEIARLATTLGHIGAIHLLLSTLLGARLLRPFAAAGRTALTLYVLQTIVLLWILFPPFGFALYGRLDWMPMMLVCVAVDLALLGVAVVYVRHFRIAPVEWAWRSIVERRRLPFCHVESGASGSGGGI